MAGRNFGWTGKAYQHFNGSNRKFRKEKDGRGTEGEPGGLTDLLGKSFSGGGMMENFLAEYVKNVCIRYRKMPTET